MELKTITQEFLGNIDFSCSEINNGLINQTYLIDSEQGKFILQRINTSIFKRPEAIIQNHLKVNNALVKSGYTKNIVKVLPTLKGKYLVRDKNNGSWRLTGFLEDSKTHIKVPSPEIAFEASKCFSEFYAAINAEELDLEDTLPGFIDFRKRLNDFQSALDQASEERLAEAKVEINFIKDLIDLPEKWISLELENLLPKRTIHADPKISNILFTIEDKALAVIDLDTVMTSTLLYDFGDMVRSYCNSTDEDDATLKENFNNKIYSAVKEGFISQLESTLTPVELENLDYAAQVVIYIQAVRFLSDYLNRDVYYTTKYESHNLDRTKNQIQLLKNLRTWLS